MFGAPVRPNCVYVSMVQTGCCKSGFDSTYPIHLNGIIRQDEFHQSIDNINRTISSRKPRIICGLIFLFCVLGGIALFVADGITSTNSRILGFPLLAAIGFGVTSLGILVLLFGCCIIQFRRTTQMQQAIAKESMNYSMRSPTPCSWRLDASRIWGGGYGRHRRSRVFRQLVIEIGHTAAPGSGRGMYQSNQVAPQSASSFPQQNNMAPPPYYGQHTGGYCSRCGASQQNSAAKICSSCGQPLNPY